MTDEELLNYLAIKFLENLGMKAPTELQLQRIEESVVEEFRMRSMIIFILDQAGIKFPTEMQIKRVEFQIDKLILESRNSVRQNKVDPNYQC